MPPSDILAAKREDVAAITQAEDRYSHGKWFLAKNVGEVELAQLGEIAGFGSYGNLSKEFRLVEPGDLEEGPGLSTSPRPSWLGSKRSERTRLARSRPPGRPSRSSMAG